MSVASKRVYVWLVAMGLLAAACGGPAARPSPAPASTPGAGGARRMVVVQNFRFSPAQVEVAAGTTVIWTNNDSTTHTVTSGEPSNKTGVFDMPVADGATVQFTFAQAGTFTYFCSIHPTIRGTITVK